MKKAGLIIFAAALITGLIASNLFSFRHFGGRSVKFSIDRWSGVRGSGNVSAEKRDAAGFASVEAGGVFQVIIVAKKDFSVEVEAEDNLLPLISTEVRDGVLRIETDQRLRPTRPMLVRVSAPDIEKIDASGASNFTLSDIKNSGLAVEASGASKVTIAGETSKFNVGLSGASKIDAAELKTETALIDASGASQITVNVSRELTSDLSGASKVIYSGSPHVVTRRSGASSIQAK